MPQNNEDPDKMPQNNEDPDKMPHYVASYQGLHSLSMYPI